VPFEKEIISHLRKTFEVTGEDSCLLLSQVWGISERSIKTRFTFEKQTFESPKKSGQRKESARTPSRQEMDKCKKLTMQETP